jgi:hypothetical protein
MIADILTKALPTPKFKELKKLLNISNLAITYCTRAVGNHLITSALTMQVMTERVNAAQFKKEM